MCIIIMCVIEGQFLELGTDATKLRRSHLSNGATFNNHGAHNCSKYKKILQYVFFDSQIATLLLSLLVRC